MSEEVVEELAAVVRAHVAAAVAAERERCANVCERMVVGGRAWTHEQQVSAEALLAAAKNIREGA
jgi:cytochrome b